MWKQHAVCVRCVCVGGGLRVWCVGVGMCACVRALRARVCYAIALYRAFNSPIITKLRTYTFLELSTLAM